MKKEKTVFHEVTSTFRAPTAVVKSLVELKKKTRGSGKIPVLILEDRMSKIKAVVVLSGDAKKIYRAIDEADRRYTEFVIEQLLRRR